MPILSSTPFGEMLDARYSNRHRLGRIARQLMVFLQMQLAPPAPGPKTNLLLRLWQHCEVGGATWPDYCPSLSGIRRRDDYNFMRWLLGAGERTAAVIAAARSDPAAAPALALLASRGRSGREHESRGGQWFHAMLRHEQRWYASLLPTLGEP